MKPLLGRKRTRMVCTNFKTVENGISISVLYILTSIWVLHTPNVEICFLTFLYDKSNKRMKTEEKEGTMRQYEAKKCVFGLAPKHLSRDITIVLLLHYINFFMFFS